MWKVLLVEDETRVRRLIKEIIDWEKLGFVIIGEAANGIEALKVIQEESPHFILCDILMPLMDGIELLRKSREQGFEGPFVMLTCMNEFELARQAIEYGATSYMLKLSLNVDTIREMLDKVSRELSKAAIPARQLSYRDFELLYRFTWRQIHGMDDEESERKDLLDRILASGFTHVDLCVVLHGTSGIDEEELVRSGLIHSKEAAVIHKFRMHGCTTFFSWVPRNVHSVAHGLAEDNAIGYPAVCAYSVALSELEYTWKNMIRKIEESWYACSRSRIAYPATDFTIQQPALSSQTLWNMEREILQTFERRDKISCIRQLSMMFEEMKKNHTSMTVVMEMAERLDNRFGAISGHGKAQIDHWLSAANHEELRLVLEKRIDDWLTKWIKSTILPSGHPEINRIVDYIQNHYDKEITLKLMAEYVALDEHYLSGLFSKKMGCTLIHYLHKVRIDQARFFLLQSTLTVGEIAERVGFGNVAYFVKIFKRWTEQTPSEFRKYHMSNG
ncbi:response regulator transcription factor [Paenibacillus whitsoniae]|uniref:response regulator transcription factor n=1 Tax=Paenibacillus whitsoniae TaxID=2496558 RepID=UPI0013E0D9DF|nr:helix-turn-helix domain-containing protein [Paenibacillus whitsoniae]